MQRITLALNQIKGSIQDDMCHQHIFQKYHTTYVFISSRILFLIIYCLKVCIFFYQRSGHFQLGICSPPEIWVSRSLMWASNLSIFGAEVDCTGNPSTNIWNILQFSSTYVSDFTRHTCSKCINKSLFTYERTRKITSVTTSIPSTRLKFTSRCLESSLTH